MTIKEKRNRKMLRKRMIEIKIYHLDEKNSFFEMAYKSFKDRLTWKA